MKHFRITMRNDPAPPSEGAPEYFEFFGQDETLAGALSNLIRQVNTTGKGGEMEFLHAEIGTIEAAFLLGRMTGVTGAREHDYTGGLGTVCVICGESKYDDNTGLASDQPCVPR